MTRVRLALFASAALPLALAATLFAQTAPTPQTPASPALLGFAPSSVAGEQQWEAKFQAMPEPAKIKENMHVLAAHPHNVGSAADRQDAEWLLAQYKSWGWDAHIEQFDVLYPTPLERVLEIGGDHPYKARLSEPQIPEDPYTLDKSPRMPPYNEYAKDGDVNAPLVYVNYGMQDDYDTLARHGVSVKGAIVIARYGGGWRGLKPKLAYQHGAVGCIIYSDPADDGYGPGLTIPAGPMRPEWGVQRGSVADMTLYAGDPLTPGVAAVPGAKRLRVEDSKVIMQIPTIPISWGDAQPFLSQLDGPDVPREWRGGLPITYRFGPSKAMVHLKVRSEWGTKPVLDVIATMKGSEEPDVWILRGNHYDGWVNGADDPVSGQSAMLEEARALGELAKQGWKPKRTIIYASWDGEEPGLLGSTEWAEAHADDLTKHAAVYLNSDSTGRGYISAGGSQVLEDEVTHLSRELKDPETGATVFERHRAAAEVSAGHRKHPGDAEADTLALEAIGSGSDFAGFLDHLGIAALDIAYGGEDQSGTYHSDYDTPWHYDHFSDTDRTYGRLFSQTNGTLMMRLADADVLPYDFRRLSAAVHGYTADLKQEVITLKADAEKRNAALASGAYKLASDPKDPTLPPTALPVPPAMDYTALDAALARLDAAAAHYSRVSAQAALLPEEKRKTLDERMTVLERDFLAPNGLPGRPWVKHVLYAPGTYSGYGAKTLPGVREALEAGRYDEAKQQMQVLATALTREADDIEAIANEVVRG